jgi:hypothetical protein
MSVAIGTAQPTVDERPTLRATKIKAGTSFPQGGCQRQRGTTRIPQFATVNFATNFKTNDEERTRPSTHR